MSVLSLVLALLLVLVALMALRWRRFLGHQQRIIAEQQALIEELTRELQDRQAGAQDHGAHPEERLRLPDLEQLLTPEAAAAEDVRHGIKAFMKGDFERAARILPRYAEQGHLKAQILLAKMYFSGHGVARDEERYRYWLQRAADNGHKPSKAKLKKLARS